MDSPKKKEAHGVRRRQAGRPNRALWDRGFKGQAPAIKLIHVTAVGVAREILEAGQLEARRCSQLHRDLIYFFAIRPAYRLQQGDVKSDQISRFPFVFVISSERLDAPYHVYPFDTGGALSGVFGDEPDPHVMLEDYELEPSIGAVSRYIDWAFGSISAYFDGDLRPNLMETLPQFDLEGRSVLKIARLASSGHNQPDRRASAIEVAYSQHVKLADHAEFAVLPLQFLEEDGIKNLAFLAKLEKSGLTWETYDWRPNMAPDDFRDEIARILRRRLLP